MKWGRQRNFKQTRKRIGLIKLGELLAYSFGVPVCYLNNYHTFPKNSLKGEYYKRVKNIQQITLSGLNGMTKHLPRKLKKKYRKIYRWMK